MILMRFDEFRESRLWRIFSAVMVAIVMLLQLPGPAEAGPAESDRWVDEMVSLYSEYCASLGGTSTAHYHFSVDGTVEYVDLGCVGAAPPFWCIIWGEWEDWTCVGIFSLADETITRSVEAQEGHIVEAEAGENPISTPTVELNTPETGKVDLNRPSTADPEPAATLDQEPGDKKGR